MRLEIKSLSSYRSERVKSVEFHPKEPWLLCSLYNGSVHIWNCESQSLVVTFEVCLAPG
jgi:coatomer subunit beta'